MTPGYKVVLPLRDPAERFISMWSATGQTTHKKISLEQAIWANNL